MNDYISRKRENLKIRIYENEAEVGHASADLATQFINEVIERQGSANLILATGASQFKLLEALQNREIDWEKITVFHLDEYLGISEEHPASFRKYLKERILEIVQPKEYYLIDGDTGNIEEMIKRYEKLLNEHPIDVACIGIGENGHIAFNDPPVANFNDPHLVKTVELDHACRLQQLNEGWFPSIEEVPTKAITLTIPAIMKCKAIICTVPGNRKSEAVDNTVYGPMETSCPASILTTHLETTLILDRFSASKIHQFPN